MADALKWWLTLEVLLFIGWPVVAWLFPNLKDRGIGLGRLVGLLLVAYPVWVCSHWFPVFGRGFLVFWVLFWAALSCLLFYFQRGEWKKTFLHPKEILLSEGFWILSFSGLTVLRAFNPDIVGMSAWGGCEKFMDLNFVNGILNSRQFPPQDGWLAGYPINYYYYGYYLCAVLIHLTGLLPHVGYNLMLVTVYALAIHGLWSLFRNLGLRWYWALAGIYVAFLAANLKTGVVAWQSEGLQAHQAMGTSRVIDLPTDHTINEYPIFSFMWGDLHGHLSGMSIQVGLLGLCWGAIVSFTALSNLRRTLGTVLIAVVFGSLVVTNAWDLPAYAVVLLLSLLSATTLHPKTQRPSPSLLEVAAHIGLRLFAVVAVFLFLFAPFFNHFTPPTEGHNWLPWGLKSPLSLLLLIFGTHFAFLLLPLLRQGVLGYTDLARTRTDYVDQGGDPIKSKTQGIVFFGLVFLWVAGLFLLFGFIGSLSAAVTPLLLWTLLGLGGLWLMRAWWTPNPVEDTSACINDGPATRYVAFLFLLGIGLIFGCEFVAVKDFYGDQSLRFNTVFKFHLQAWLLLSVAAAFLCDQFFRGLWTPLRSEATRRYLPAVPRLLQVFLMIGTIGWSGYGAFEFIRVMSSDFNRSPTLDGLDYALNNVGIHANHMGSDDAKAVLWLLDQQRFDPDPERRILEVPGDPYSIHGRVAAFSGVPTLVGWPNHEGIWNRGNEEVLKVKDQRARDAKTIYQTTSFQKAKDLLESYDVTQVFWGEVERREFGPSAQRKFEKYMNVAKSYGGTVVYAGYKDIPIEDSNLPDLAPQPLANSRAIRIEGRTLEQPRGIEASSDGSIYVCNSKKGTVEKVSPDGESLLVFGSPGSTADTGELSTEFSGPGSVALDNEGFVYVADTWNHRIAVFAQDGTYDRGIKIGFFGPRDLLFIGEDLIVADTGHHRLVVLSKDGDLLREIGSKGAGPGEFTEPVGLAESNGRLYVADVGNARVQVFNSEYRFVTSFDVAGWEDQVWTEPYLAVDGAGTLWLTDSGKSRLERFSPEGKLLGIFGPLCPPSGEIRNAKGIAWWNGNLILSDFGNNRLLVAPTPAKAASIN